MSRKLASIQKIASFTPIEGKDRIVLASFVEWGWQAIVNKNDFQVGDYCVFIEPDSLLPSDNPAFAFMEAKHFKVKTMKMAGVISQGLVMPISILPDGVKLQRGKDVTELLKITEFTVDEDVKAPQIKEVYAPKKKYPNWLMKHKWFRNIVLKNHSKREIAGFPMEISKTDETRIQENPKLAELYSPVVATEKVDGTSSTYLLRRIKPNHFWQRETWDFCVCSHNRRLYDKNDMKWIWQNAEKYKIEEKLRELLMYEFSQDDWIAIQGETIAPKIQGNNYNLKAGETDLYVFNVITQSYGRLNVASSQSLTRSMGMKFVPVLMWNMNLSGLSVPDILKLATGKSIINPSNLREGIVFRSATNSLRSFKAVSPEYDLGGNHAAV